MSPLRSLSGCFPYQRSSHGPGDQGLKALQEVPCARTRTYRAEEPWLKGAWLADLTAIVGGQL
jgi:hypothetical protein